MKKLLTLVAAIALTSVGHAEDTCHVFQAAEGQKLNCIESKLEGKLNQMQTAIDSIQNEIRQEVGRSDDESGDTAERAARMTKLKLALKGAVAEMREALEKAKSEIRDMAGRENDGAIDATERAARMQKLKSFAQRLEAKFAHKVNQVESFFRNIFSKIKHH